MCLQTGHIHFSFNLEILCFQPGTYGVLPCVDFATERPLPPIDTAKGLLGSRQRLCLPGDTLVHLTLLHTICEIIAQQASLGK